MPPTRVSDGTLDGYQLFKVPMTSITVRATEEHRHRQEGSRAREEHVRARAWSRGCSGAPPRPRSTGSSASSAASRRSSTRTSRRSRPATTSARPPSCSRSPYQVAAAPGRAGHLPQRRRVDGAVVGPGRGRRAQRAAVVLRQLSRSPRPRSCCTSSRRHKNFGVITLQAEDEIAAANMALGAAFAGHLAVTGTSGPGMDLKAETLGLAVIMELPHGHRRRPARRARPPGLPTKTEQGDLLLAMFGRHGESPDADRGGVLAGGLLRRGAWRRRGSRCATAPR